MPNRSRSRKRSRHSFLLQEEGEQQQEQAGSRSSTEPTNMFKPNTPKHPHFVRNQRRGDEKGNDRDDDDDDDDGLDTKEEGEEGEDPFPYVLRCRALEPHERPPQVVWWYSAVPYVPVHVEERMKGALVKWNETERGMMKDQPPFRVQQVRKKCQQLRIPLSLALSLRRHYMKQYNPYLSMEQLRLGKELDVRTSAQIFERCVAEFLTRNDVPYWTEQEQKRNNQRHMRTNGGGPYPPTPDFVLKRPIHIKRFYYDKKNAKQKHLKEKRNGYYPNNNHQEQQPENRIIVSNEQEYVNWIEVKMFYGASTVSCDDNLSAVGCLGKTCAKYTKLYGPGAVIFMQGCGTDLAQKLQQLGVLALDCCSMAHGAPNQRRVHRDGVRNSNNDDDDDNNNNNNATGVARSNPFLMNSNYNNNNNNGNNNNNTRSRSSNGRNNDSRYTTPNLAADDDGDDDTGPSMYHTINLEPVYRHQRTWCANADGMILP